MYDRKSYNLPQTVLAIVDAAEAAEFKTLPQMRPELVVNATPPAIAEMVAVSAPGICSEIGKKKSEDIVLSNPCSLILT